MAAAPVSQCSVGTAWRMYWQHQFLPGTKWKLPGQVQIRHLSTSELFSGYSYSNSRSKQSKRVSFLYDIVLLVITLFRTDTR